MIEMGEARRPRLVRPLWAPKGELCSRCLKLVLVGTGLQTGAATNFRGRAGTRVNRVCFGFRHEREVLNRAGREARPHRRNLRSVSKPILASGS